MDPKRSGFSLVGILIVIGIIAVASGLAVVNLVGAKTQTDFAKAEQIASDLNKAAVAFEISGGDLSAAETLPEAIALISGGFDAASERQKITFGQLISNRLQATPVASGNQMPVLNFSGSRFSAAKSGAGFLITQGSANQVSDASVSTEGLTFHPDEEGWIWKHEGASGPTALSPTTRQLNPPEFVYNGRVPLPSFPLSNILTFPPNPSGTTYHYTVDGSPPSASSPVWPNPIVDLSSIPPTFRAIAVHPSPEWTDSVITQSTILVGLEIEYLREDGSESTGFLFSEVTGGSNRVVLLVPGVDPGDYQIRYTGDGSTPTGSSDLYTGPFHFDAFQWPRDGRPLRAIAFPVSGTQVVQSPTLDRTLMPVPVKLPRPEFSEDPTAGPLSSGGVVTVTNTEPTHSEFRSEADPAEMLEEVIPSETARFTNSIIIP